MCPDKGEAEAGLWSRVAESPFAQPSSWVPGHVTHHHLLKNALQLRLHLYHRSCFLGFGAGGPDQARALRLEGRGAETRRKPQLAGSPGSLSSANPQLSTSHSGPSEQPEPEREPQRCVRSNHKTGRNQNPARWFRR